jgi:hypothetical protein
MNQAGVPEATQAELLGGNARRMYGIEPKVFVTDEAPPIDRPDWFPQGLELEEWADLVSHPRENADKITAMAAVAGSAIAQGGLSNAGGSY